MSEIINDIRLMAKVALAIDCHILYTKYMELTHNRKLKTPNPCMYLI
jgi:hypothetical protein